MSVSSTQRSTPRPLTRKPTPSRRTVNGSRPGRTTTTGGALGLGRDRARHDVLAGARRARRCPAPETPDTTRSTCGGGGASGRSAFVPTTSCGRSASAGSYAATSVAHGGQVGGGVVVGQVHHVDSTRHRETCRRKSSPSPLPSCAPWIRPGTSATTMRSLGPRDAEVRRERRERVVGDLRPGRRQRREQRGLAGVRAARPGPTSATKRSSSSRRCSSPVLARLGGARRAVAGARRATRSRARRGRRARRPPMRPGRPGRPRGRARR